MSTMNSGTPIWQWSACDLAGAIRDGSVSASEALESVLERVSSKNEKINAVIDDLSDEARKTAERPDETLKSDGPVGPLHGVPMTVKVNVDVKGRANSNGVVEYRNNIAPDDAPLVCNLRRAGAVIFGLTNVPEFSFRVTTDNELYGRTVNPWDEQRSPGGSSGGAAAAVASGFGPLAHGNDIGGSLRIPSFMCGAVTVKPTPGRVPVYNPSAPAERGLVASMMSVQGVIGREVRDVRVATRAMVAPDPRDPMHVPLPFDGPPLDAPIRVAVVGGSDEYPVHPDTQAAVDKAAAQLSDAGYHVEAATPPDMPEISESARRVTYGDAMLGAYEQIEKFGSENINKVFGDGSAIFPPFKPDELLHAMSRRTALLRRWTVFLDKYPLVLTPFLRRPGYDWDADTRGQNGVRDLIDNLFYCNIVNFLGLPASIAPAGFHDDLPISVQLIGRRFREDVCLDAAEIIERAQGVQIHELWRRDGDRDTP